MEAFQLLSRGGTRFDKQKFKNDILLFTNEKSADTKGKAPANSETMELPAELDFFKYAEGGNGMGNVAAARKQRSADCRGDGEPERKRHKMDDDSNGQDHTSAGNDATTQRHRVVAKGLNIPKAISSFQELQDRYQVSSLLISNLIKNGHLKPTGVQSYGIPVLLEARDLAAISPTGTGKTLAYLLPIMAALGSPSASMKNGAGDGARAVIVAPTRELAHQIHNECAKLAQGRKWRIVLYSKATASTMADKKVRAKVDIIITTPLRLVASLQAGTVELHNVRHLVLDEADRLLDAEFLSQVQEIVESCTYERVQKSVFSATLPAGVEKIAMGMLQDPIRIVVGLKDTPLPLISQTLTYVADDASKLPSLLSYLAQPYNPPVLIFTSTQPRASSLAEELVLNGVPNVDCLHAGLSKKEREDAVSRMRKGESWVMVSTEVMARGMDFKGVREVINYDFPTSVQSYVHRIGRTGRAGREGKAVTYFTDEDAPFLKSIANVLLQSGSSVPEWMTKLPKSSQMKRRQMGKVRRAEMVNPARRIGRADAIKKRDMIAGSKRRKQRREQGSADQ